MTPQDLFRRRLRELRELRAWSQARLAEEVSGRGGVMTQTTVTRLERGPRQVTLDELLSLAGALEVSPLVLLLPEDEAAEVRVDSRTLTGQELAGWYLGADEQAASFRGLGQASVPTALLGAFISRAPLVLEVLAGLEEDGTQRQQLLLDAAARAQWLVRKHYQPSKAARRRG